MCNCYINIIVYSVYSPSEVHPMYPELALRPYLKAFKRKMSEKDKHRVVANKSIKKHQMVKKTVSKTGKVQVFLDGSSDGHSLHMHSTSCKYMV